ncbi:MAG: RtcB family protein [Patescibacteria group bacterium]|nr:RtcB family protein [Patescibacteria group bacterium]
MRYNLIPDGKNRFRIKKQGYMIVDAVVYVKQELRQEISNDRSLEQLTAAASLTGVLEPVIGMPDIHEGFGLPIGGVMAMDSKNGQISAGAVGYDINCGVRLVKTNLPANYFYLSGTKTINKPKLRSLMQDIEKHVPMGTGKSGWQGVLPNVALKKVAEEGIKILVEKGYGSIEDISHTEEEGCLIGGALEFVSDRAQKRGRDQLGTLGGGNHFIDIQVIDKIFDQKLADQFNLKENNVCVMIHCGSRGFGHQIGDDYMRLMSQEAQRNGIHIPLKGLAAMPIASKIGQQYWSAMAAAVNFAFGNRHLIMHYVREAFERHFGKSAKELGMDLLYDVAHNIAKFEPAQIRQGGQKGGQYLIHRKGATRALPAGHPQNPKIYQKTGHPVLVPGSMATPSYVLVGTEAAAETFYSVNHGAGRLMSRNEAKRTITPQEFEQKLGSILTNFRNVREVLDEAPMVYKDIDLVVDTLVECGITKKVARLAPIAVMIGKE